MSEEAYNAREGTYRKYREEQARLKGASEPKATESVDAFPLIQVGARCRLVDGGHRGQVAYFGPVDKRGIFVGIRLDEPFGKARVRRMEVWGTQSPSLPERRHRRRKALL